MKKSAINIFLILGICFFSLGETAFADLDGNAGETEATANMTTAPTQNSGNSAGSSTSSATTSSTSSSTTTTVTEKIPGMNCELVGSDESVTKRKYKCTIQSGFGSVMDILKGLIKYATFITALIGVLMLVYSGIEYSMAGASGDDVKHSKSRITKVLAGLVLLFLIGFVLNTVAPWIYK